MTSVARRGLQVLVLGLVALFLVPGAVALTVKEDDFAPFVVSALQPADAVPGEYLVQFREAPSWEWIRADLAGAGIQIVREFRETGLAQVKIPEAGRERILDWIAARPDVEFIEPNYIFRIATAPNDPLFPQLWGLDNTGQTGGTSDADIDAPEAWTVTTGTGNGPLVAIVDTGVDYTHPDLAANIWTNPGEIPGNGIDDDGNGYVDDVHGWNAIANGGDPMDDNGHGTHCAGTIGGVGNNGIGVAGVNWHTQIVACKFLDKNGAGSLGNAVTCINYLNTLIDHGVPVRVASYSWGALTGPASLKNAINRQRSRGVLVAAAAGNSNVNMDRRLFRFYPASYALDNIISVGATDSRDNRASFSNYGKTYVDLGAPGVDIWSTVPPVVAGATCMTTGGCYASFSGTSMATPHVAGTAALYLSINPTASYAAVKSRILNGVDKKPSLANYFATGGRLNAYRTITGV